MSPIASKMIKAIRSSPFYSLFQRLYRLGTTGEHWARVVMEQDTRNLISDLHPERLDVLEISGSQWQEKDLFKSYQHVSYPDFDICQNTLRQKFDLIIAEQVFEHLLWPYRAGKNIYTMLKPGGHFLMTTPFLIRVHLYPTDCSRWTETGIRYFLAECGFPLKNIRTNSWGNRACIKANFHIWANYRPFLHSLRNEPDFPVSVWVLAQK